MPEGDTVWRTAHELHAALAGEPLVRSDLRVPRFATADLTGRRTLDVTPRGKHLLARLEGGLTLHSHLGMDGSWRVHAAGERRRGGPEHQIRAVLATAAHTAVGYRLPVLELLRTAEEERIVGHLGPDLLGPDWDAGEALRRLLERPERPVGEALLDQRVLAGIGNVYRSELCFLARRVPWAPVGTLPAPERLLALAHRLLRDNRLRLARSTTGRDRRDHRLWVYGREHRPCRRCGTAVRAGELGPPDALRIAYWCPGCQVEPECAEPGGAEPGRPAPER
ncbi:DNA-formamidopyrimidine glycosylase family protein [Streptomyces sp. JJ36]|uniref:DNA-formamidopyrimidine glycosylase family protein n=1 Tax=Streptomyces sp. JJ36 TaxID=2736645 RepID=UPI001F23DC36|nr:DNA-formamidopyrimidine glycosylase family protein [Streptomyces sp. JJ36]MCF6523902.1 Fpg/Nei family DNA glycosylase [Streptomyces sp. JJ36]